MYTYIWMNELTLTLTRKGANRISYQNRLSAILTVQICPILSNSNVSIFRIPRFIITFLVDTAIFQRPPRRFVTTSPLAPQSIAQRWCMPHPGCSGTAQNADCTWLVVENLPLLKIWKSAGMIPFPTKWKNKKVPNHQPGTEWPSGSTSRPHADCELESHWGQWWRTKSGMLNFMDKAQVISAFRCPLWVSHSMEVSQNGGSHN